MLVLLKPLKGYSEQEGIEFHTQCTYEKSVEVRSCHSVSLYVVYGHIPIPSIIVCVLC